MFHNNKTQKGMFASEQTKLLYTPRHRYYILRQGRLQNGAATVSFFLWKEVMNVPTRGWWGSQQGEDGQDRSRTTTMILTRKDHPRLIDTTWWPSSALICTFSMLTLLPSLLLCVRGDGINGAHSSAWRRESLGPPVSSWLRLNGWSIQKQEAQCAIRAG